MAELFPRYTWAEHMAYMRHPRLGWRQGEHMLIVGPTGSGKTTLADQISKVRTDNDAFVIMPVTKARDKSLTTEGDNLRHFGIMREWNRTKADQLKRVMLWPLRDRDMTGPEFTQRQRLTFLAMLDDVGNRGHRTVIVDEMHMMCDPEFIGLKKHIALAFHQGRSDDVTMVALSQRPSWIPVIVYPSVSHVYLANTGELDDLKRLAGIGRSDRRKVIEAVSQLGNHDWLYLNPTGVAPGHIVNIRK